MQTRSVAEFVRAIQEPIRHFALIGCQFDASQPLRKMLFLLQAIEAKITFQKLLVLLEAQSLKQEPLTAETAKPFYQFLADRWEKIQQTDSAYPMAPQIPVNRACKLLAEQLASIESKHVFSLLMPTVHFDHYPEKLHQFIINTTNKALPVAGCFQYLEKREVKSARVNSRHSRTLVRSDTSSSELILLDSDVELLITSHSPLAREYANEIVLQQNLEAKRTAFLTSLNSDDYMLSASYGENGKRRLLEVLIQDLRAPIAVSTFLYTHVPKSEWLAFLELLGTDTLFDRILIINLPQLRKDCEHNEDYFKKQWQAQTEAQLLDLSNAQFSFKHDDELRAFLICLLAVYKVCRKELPDHKTNYGKFAGMLFSNLVPTREQKLAACDYYCDYLLSDAMLPPSWEQLQKARDYANHQASLTGNSVLPKLVALGDRSYKAMHKDNARFTQYGSISLHSQ